MIISLNAQILCIKFSDYLTNIKTLAKHNLVMDMDMGFTVKRYYCQPQYIHTIPASLNINVFDIPLDIFTLNKNRLGAVKKGAAK